MDFGIAKLVFNVAGFIGLCATIGGLVAIAGGIVLSDLAISIYGAAALTGGLGALVIAFIGLALLQIAASNDAILAKLSDGSFELSQN